MTEDDQGDDPELIQRWIEKTNALPGLLEVALDEYDAWAKKIKE